MESASPPLSRWARVRRAALLTLFGITIYLAVEAFQPPARQPSARLSIWLIDAYRSAGSPVLSASGVRCRYTPTCSHYASASIAHYGTLEGGLRTLGRLWRCSPWGGAGYDPAVAARP